MPRTKNSKETKKNIKSKIKRPKSRAEILISTEIQDLFTEDSKKGFPDFLECNELLEILINEIRNEPRLLYDEIYVINNRPNLAYHGHSIIKIIINKLRRAFITSKEKPDSTETWEDFDKFVDAFRNVDVNRLIEAREWLIKIFDAAISGLKDIVDFPGGRPKRSGQNIKQEYEYLCKKLKAFMKSSYPNCIQEKRNFTRLKFPEEGRAIETVLKAFWSKNKGHVPLAAVSNISLKPASQTNTISKIAKIIVAENHDLKPSSIKNYLNK